MAWDRTFRYHHSVMAVTMLTVISTDTVREKLVCLSVRDNARVQ